LAKQTFESLRNSIMLLGLDFMPSDQIGHMSVNGFRWQVSTHNKTQTKTRIDESSVTLDLVHMVLSSGAPMFPFCPP